MSAYLKSLTCCSVTQSWLSLCNPMDCSTPGLPVHHHLPELAQMSIMSIKSVMPSNPLALCCSLLLLPSIFPSIRVFSNELALHSRWPKFWSFSVSPANEYSGLISFRIDWFDLLVFCQAPGMQSTQSLFLGGIESTEDSNLSIHSKQSSLHSLSSMSPSPFALFILIPSSEFSGFISFRIDWLDLLAVQGTLKSVPQYHSSKASILQRSSFFMLQLSHPCKLLEKP